MRFFILAALLASCSGDAGFSNTSDDVEDVHGLGQIEVEPESISFTDMEVEVTRSQYLKVSSVGEENLVIYEIRIFDSGGDVFYMEEKEDIFLAPGQYKEFAVVATLHEASPATGSIRIECNDPDSNTVYVNLSASPAASEDTGL